MSNSPIDSIAAQLASLGVSKVVRSLMREITANERALANLERQLRPLEEIRATWWAGEKPNAYILHRNGTPIGVMALPETRLNRLTLPCELDLWSSIIGGPQLFPAASCPLVYLVRRSRLFWQVSGANDGGSIDDVAGFYPSLMPLPNPQFVTLIGEGAW